jgi:hypothetical protein
MTAARDDPTAMVRWIGPALVFERLWAETGLRAVIEALPRRRKHDFALARAIFLTGLHGLMGGLDLAADRWRVGYRITGVEPLRLHHLGRFARSCGRANVADVTTPIPVIDRLRTRFAIGRICVVADRGVINTEAVAALEKRKLLYLFATRKRTDQAARDVVLADPASHMPLTIAKRGQDTD